MKRDLLLRYFESIKEKTDGDNTSNSEIIDYENGNSIDIDQVENEYYNYLDLQQKISNYIEENDLDDVADKDKIKNHFNKIDDDLFEFNQAVLKNFVDYMVIKINKKNEKQRKTNIIFGKNGNGYTTTKITLPVGWIKDLGFTENDKSAIIKIQGDIIEIKKEEETDRYITRDREAGNVIDYFSSLAEARKAIEAYERSDKAEDIYEENFYEIYDSKAEEIVD